MKKYPNLLKPIKIGNLTLKNRIIAAPTGMMDFTPDGRLTPYNVCYYELKAMGGAAVVTIGESITDSKTGESHNRQIHLDDPESNMFHKKAIDKEVKKYIIPCVNTTAREITPEGVICTDLQGKEIFVKADTVILSAGMRPRTKVVEELEGVVDEFYMIGDCVKAGQVTQAMSQAYFTAREI